ncbi:MAG: hypothetical protein JWN34_4642 [Bryobacterales bacterium]|nr:hypothetical protein [Bryobacterales bacterium]
MVPESRLVSMLPEPATMRCFFGDAGDRTKGVGLAYAADAPDHNR